MIWAHPTTLQTLVDRYEQYRQLELAGQTDPQLQAKLRDTAYTLCISTGTRHVGLALAVARNRIAQSRLEPAPAVAAVPAASVVPLATVAPAATAVQEPDASPRPTVAELAELAETAS
jgi:hypothetical protein